MHLNGSHLAKEYLVAGRHILNFTEPLHLAGSRLRLAEVNRGILALNAKAGHYKVLDDLKSPLHFDQLHYRIKPEATHVGDKVFETERMVPVRTETFRDADGGVVLSPSTITKRYSTQSSMRLRLMPHTKAGPASTSSSSQCHAIPCDTMQYHAIPCNAMHH